MKTRRHKMIREIVEQQQIETQYQLTEALLRNGFKVTQATVSRDIKELGLIKVAGANNTFRYSFQPGSGAANNMDRTRKMLRDNLLRVEVGRDLVVLHTLPGAAQGVCFCLDNLSWDEILGTIAGDDTIFVAPRSDASATALADRIREMMF